MGAGNRIRLCEGATLDLRGELISLAVSFADVLEEHEGLLPDESSRILRSGSERV